MAELYFDTAATTPISPDVQRAMVDAFDVYGNPSSLHRLGMQAEDSLKNARAKVMKALGAQNGRLVFTGCGTEANNLAIFGAAKRYSNRGGHLVTTQVEHPSVMEAYRALETDGWSVTYVAPNNDGSVDAAAVVTALRDDTVLVSMMHVNNETGAILPVVEVGAALQNRPKTLFHVDGIQAFGKIPYCARAVHADLYAVSGHKIGAPKGVGALFVRQGVALEPLLHGGGQEDGLRSGTENTLGITAMAAAAEVATREAEARFGHVSRLSNALVDALATVPKCRIHRPEPSSPYIVSAAFPGLRGEVLVHAFEAQGLYVSTGSACSTRGGHVKGSHVLRAMKVPAEEIEGTIRFSLGYWHTPADVERAVEIVRTQVEWLSQLER